MPRRRRRLARHTRNALTLLSLLLCVATVALWVRSYRVCDSWERITPVGVDDVSLSRGLLMVHRGRYDRPDPTEHARWEHVPTAAYDLDGMLCGPGADWNPTRFHCVGSYDRHDGIRYGEVTVPLWCLGVLASVAPAVASVAHVRRARRVRRGSCIACDYDLTGNVSGVCPECGTKVGVA